jgi:hypothetical protein
VEQLVYVTKNYPPDLTVQLSFVSFMLVFAQTPSWVNKLIKICIFCACRLPFYDVWF